MDPSASVYRTRQETEPLKAKTDWILPPGAVKLLDGGNGTELQRRGVPMATQSWCGPVAPEHLPTLEAIHRDYIDAGADIITANTYSTSRLLLELDGIGSEFDRINRAAVRTAQRARDVSGRDDLLIAGSLSHRGPIAQGTAAPDTSGHATPVAMADALCELAQLLRDECCDLVLLEMMYDPALIPTVLDAAAESGLPVWVGFSARRAIDGHVLGFDPGEEQPFAEVVAALASRDVAAAGIMHTPSDLVSDALSVLKSVYDGPLLAYPDSGYFKSPNWQFEDVIAPDDLRAYAETWVAEGVQILGGCCGLGPDHIASLAPLRRAGQSAPS